MLKTKGTLLIKSIHSRNGRFCVADLITEFGEFKVKDPMLDQFEEGEYQGTIWINQIYMAPYVAYGKVVTELRAKLHDIQISSQEELPKTPPQNAEPDPIDEEAARSRNVPATPPAQPAVDQSTAGSLQTPQSAPPAPQEKSSVATGGDDGEFTFESVVALYGQEIADDIDNLRVIKLDPTVDRALLREQTKTLRELLGYVFDAKIQSWVHTSTR
jgi:hypothetical protein